jgi:hypothetical protein
MDLCLKQSHGLELPHPSCNSDPWSIHEFYEGLDKSTADQNQIHINEDQGEQVFEGCYIGDMKRFALIIFLILHTVHLEKKLDKPFHEALDNPLIHYQY